MCVYHHYLSYLNVYRAFIIPLNKQIDRNNASAARLQGFEEDLHLQDRQFDTLLSILYIGYILMQVPS